MSRTSQQREQPGGSPALEAREQRIERIEHALPVVLLFDELAAAAAEGARLTTIRPVMTV